MKEIKISRLTLENFKCHAYLNLDLDGRSRSIYGDNATGKTSIYDALTWLLFGKDSAGNGEKNIDIKPLGANGEVKDHQAITAVEAEFLVDGQTVTLRRTYREIWTTRRGSGDAVFDGNTSDYFVDGVPQKKNAFDAMIRDLVSEDLFRMLTSVNWFAAGMKWQDRRAVLFDMAGTMTDREIMAGEPRFSTLMDSLGNLSLSDYKAKLLSQRKGLVGVRNDAPTRINECQRTLQDLQGIDFAAAREEEKALTAQREALSGRLIAMEQDAALEKKRLELREAKLELDTMESRNRAYRDGQKAGPDPAYLRSQLDGEQVRLQNLRTLADKAKAGLARYDSEIQRNRELWVRVNGEAFSGGICPACGQSLPFEQLKSATANFDAKKRERLDAIEQTANRLKDERGQAESRIAEMEQEAAERQDRIRSLEQQIRDAQSASAAVRDMDGYADGAAFIKRKISGIQTEIDRLTADSAQVRDTVRAELDAVNDSLRSAQRMIAREAVKEQTMRRVEELKADARNAAEALECIDKMLFQIEEFTRFKAAKVENSVNGLFRLATFRLFREQANGGLEERCDVVYDGVPYIGLNNGAKINVGIDIINALSRHYGVTVPLFVDNAEAVTRLEDCGTQVIRLVVSEEDKELRVI